MGERRLFRSSSSATQLRVSLIAVLSVLALWSGLTYLGIISEQLLPSPRAVLKAFGQLWSDGHGGVSLITHTLFSVKRIFLGLGLAIITAAPIGVAMGLHDTTKAIFDPILEFYRSLPPLAYLPLIIVWFGIGELSKVVVIFLACFPPICIGLMAKTKAIEQEKIRAALCLGASRWRTVLKIVIPYGLPAFFSSVRIASGFAWTTLVAAEMVAASEGLGHVILTASEFLQTPVVIAGILIIALCSVAMDFGIRYLSAKIVHWEAR